MTAPAKNKQEAGDPVMGFRKAYRWTDETIPDEAKEVAPSIETMGNRIDILTFLNPNQCRRAFKHLSDRNFPAAMDAKQKTIRVILPDIFPIRAKR